jgi:hypothetical protein
MKKDASTPSRKRARTGSNQDMELKDDGSCSESSSEDEESGEKNLSTSFELQTTKGVQRPLSWIAGHVGELNFTTRWMDHHFEKGLITVEDLT